VSAHNYEPYTLELDGEDVLTLTLDQVRRLHLLCEAQLRHAGEDPDSSEGTMVLKGTGTKSTWKYEWVA